MWPEKDDHGQPWKKDAHKVWNDKPQVNQLKHTRMEDTFQWKYLSEQDSTTKNIM